MTKDDCIAAPPHPSPLNHTPGCSQGPRGFCEDISDYYRKTVFLESSKMFPYYVVILFYMFSIYFYDSVCGYTFMCGAHKSTETYTVCRCFTTMEMSGKIRVDCTGAPWLERIPTFSKAITKSIDVIEMTGTVFCRNIPDTRPSYSDQAFSCGPPEGENFLCIPKFRIMCFLYFNNSRNGVFKKT